MSYFRNFSNWTAYRETNCSRCVLFEQSNSTQTCENIDSTNGFPSTSDSSLRVESELFSNCYLVRKSLLVRLNWLNVKIDFSLWVVLVWIYKSSIVSFNERYHTFTLFCCSVHRKWEIDTTRPVITNQSLVTNRNLCLSILTCTQIHTSTLFVHFRKSDMLMIIFLSA